MAKLPLAVRRRPPPEAIRWVERSLGGGARVTSVRRLRAGTSAAVHLLRIEGVRGLEWVVLRRFVLDWIAEEPDVAEREARILEAIEGHDLPVPRLLACDASGAEAGAAAVLMTRVPGRLDLAPRDLEGYVRQLAEFLPRLHAIGSVEGIRSYRPWFRDHPFEPPSWSRQPELWLRANGLAVQAPPEVAPTFIHRDYHPGNVLWRYGRLTGVTDWVNASNGPPGIDVSHCRVNLSALFGVEVAEDFRRAYEHAAGVEQHPYWDLLDALDTGAPSENQWHDAGRFDLTDEVTRARCEEYLLMLVRRLG